MHFVLETAEQIEVNTTPLSSLTTDLGFVCITKADDVFVLPREAAIRKGCEPSALKPFAIGEEVRDWAVNDQSICLFPYTDEVELRPKDDLKCTLRFIWRCRTPLFDRKVFGGDTYRDVGKDWYSYGQIPVERFKLKTSITFAFVATHNHFVLDRGGKVFNRTAPVIKLPAGASKDEHLGLLGLLNSSVACFWLKQVCFNKGMGEQPWADRYEHDSGKVSDLPLPSKHPVEISRQLDRLARELAATSPAALLASSRPHQEPVDG